MSNPITYIALPIVVLAGAYLIARVMSVAYFISKREYQHQFLKDLEGEKANDTTHQ